jgi:type IV pilus assembly protein PilC
MPVFQYSALDAQGVEVKDEIEALSQKEAISKIRNMGYFPTKVGEASRAQKGKDNTKRPKSGFYIATALCIFSK